MKPRHWSQAAVRFFRMSLLLSGVVLTTLGCATPLFRGQTPDPEELTHSPPAPVVEENETKLISDIANPWGMNSQVIEAIGLVTGLDGTGSDPPPSPQRQMLLDEIKTHDVKDPNKLLASPSTSMVFVRGFLPPGVKKGDRFDLELHIPIRSETTSLRGGWLMQSRMKEVAILGGSMRQGHINAIGEGDILVDAAFTESQDKVLLTRGRVLGGGVSHLNRTIGLVVRAEESSVRTAALIAAAVNNRFFTFDHGKKVGAATAKRDNFVELALPPRYQNNIWHYMRIVRAIAFHETPTERLLRMQSLEKKLTEPTTAPEAAIQLEAIGREAISTLKKGLHSSHPEVRFAASEALAYMDEAEAADALAEAARNTAAFRWSALKALSSMDHVTAYDVLNDLLQVSSAETRYGAFRSLRQRNPRDPIVRGESLGVEGVNYQVIPTSSDPLVHFSKSERPEIVLFGSEQKIKPPLYLYAGKQIMIKGIENERLKVIRFHAGKDDEIETISNDVALLVPQLFKFGANYTDVMQCLLKARKDGYLESRIAIDALPKPGRTYYRDEIPDEPPGSGADSEENFEDSRSKGDDQKNRPNADFNQHQETVKKPNFFERVLSKMIAD